MRSSGSIKRHFRRSFSVSIFIQIFVFGPLVGSPRGRGGDSRSSLLSIVHNNWHYCAPWTSKHVVKNEAKEPRPSSIWSFSLSLSPPLQSEEELRKWPHFFFFFGLHHWPHLTSFIPLCNQHIDLAASFRNVLIWIFCWCCCLFRFDRWAGSGAGVSSAPCITATVKCAAKTIFTCSYSHPLSFKGTASLFFLIFHFLSPFALALLRRFKKKHIGECAFFALDFHCVGWLVIGCVQGD